MLLQTVGALVLVLLVIFTAGFAAKYLAGRVNGGFRGTRYVKILDRFSLSKDKMLVVFAMGRQAYLICLTNQGMSLIDQKDLSELEQIKEEPGAFSDAVSGAGEFMKEYLQTRFPKKHQNREHGVQFSEFWEKAKGSGKRKVSD